MDEFQGFWGDFTDSWALILGQHSKEVDGMGEVVGGWGGWWKNHPYRLGICNTAIYQSLIEYRIMIPCAP